MRWYVRVKKVSRKFGTRNVEIWPYVPIFWRFSGFLHLPETLRGKMKNNLFFLVSALRGANVFSYALLLDVDLTNKRFVVFAQTN